METTANTLLCDADIVPDGAVVVIEDVGANGTAGTYVDADIDAESGVPWHALWVHTMNRDECDLTGKRVRVRVLTGTDTDGLGDMVFDGELSIASGVLGVGDKYNPSRHLLFGSPTVVHGRVFIPAEPETIHFTDPPADYPASGPGSFTVLLDPDPGFAPAIDYPTVGRAPLAWLIRRAARKSARH